MTPRILAQTLRTLGKRTPADQVGSLVERFVNYGASRGWHMHFPRVIQLLQDDEQIEYDAEVVAARELSADEKKPLETIFGDASVRYVVDTEVLGGIKVRYRDEQWDMTTNRALHELHAFLAS